MYYRHSPEEVHCSATEGIPTLLLTSGENGKNLVSTKNHTIETQATRNLRLDTLDQDTRLKGHTHGQGEAILTESVEEHSIDPPRLSSPRSRSLRPQSCTQDKGRIVAAPDRPRVKAFARRPPQQVAHTHRALHAVTCVHQPNSDKSAYRRCYVRDYHREGVDGRGRRGEDGGRGEREMQSNLSW